MERLVQDLRYAARQLRRTPVFTLAAVACLALGIGANTAIFSVINTILIRPLPYPSADRLVWVFESNDSRHSERNSVSPANYLDWRAANRVFDLMAALTGDRMTLAGGGEPAEVPVEIATAETFPLLGLTPVLGRTYSVEETRPGGPSVVVLSHELWVRRFGAAKDIVGRTITLDGTDRTVIGVLAPGARIVGLPRAPEVWVPFVLDPATDYRETSGRYMMAIGRLAPGVSRDRAQAEMATIARRLETEHPEFNRGWSVNLVPMREAASDTLRRPLLVLAGVVGLVLLIACANAANLQLAQATARRREIAVRAALGASRWRVVRQLVAESVLLALAGGVCGVLLALWLTDALAAMASSSIPRLGEVRVDAATLGFTFGLSLVAGIMFGLLPAVHAGRADLHESLKDGGRGVSAGAGRTRTLLVVSQVAFSLVLLTGAGLLLKSFKRLQDVELGFQPDHVLTARVSLPAVRYDRPEQQAAFFEQALAQIRAIPTVTAAGAINWLPLSGLRSRTDLWFEGHPEPPAGEKPGADVSVVDPGYFGAMRIALLQGRTITAEDGPRQPKVVLVSRSFAERYLPGEQPIGQRIIMPWIDTLRATIVGVVADVKHAGLDSLAAPTTYWPEAQFPWSAMTLVIRTTGDPTALASAVAARIHALDPTLAVAETKPLEAYLGDSLARRRFSMTLLASFAGLALVLTAVGLYGVMAYAVVLRTRELGIRLALGASQQAILRSILRRGLALVGAGVAIGLTAALALTGVLRALLYDVSATDPQVFGLIVVLLGLVGAAASWLPARRATRVDPTTALRSE